MMDLDVGLLVRKCLQWKFEYHVQVKEEYLSSATRHYMSIQIRICNLPQFCFKNDNSITLTKIENYIKLVSKLL